jgi:hypothetical protein
MLTDEERDRLIEEETVKEKVRKTLEVEPKERNALLRIVKSDNFKWIVTTLAIPLTVFIWSEHAKWREDQDRKSAEASANIQRERVQRTETAQHNIDLVIKLLPAISKKTGDPERQNAFLVIKTLEDVSELPRTLRATILNKAAELGNDVAPDGTYRTAAARQDTEALSGSNPSSEDIAQNRVAPSSIVVPGTKAYIQIFSDSQLRTAEELQTIARDIGIAAPGIENVVMTATKRNRKPPVGYDAPVLLVFKEDDREIADKLAKEVEKRSGIKLTIRYRGDKPAFKNVPAGQVEIWLADPTRHANP